ncbi:MAG TPA: C4-dicarboxylate transporter DcuC [Gemmatales bacterium]|nr:C4-dicarboxylate transporter DcuC [Gemmatales bacterium]
MTWTALAGLSILAVVLFALAKGAEVRLTLLVASFALAALSQQTEKIIITIFQGMADATSVIPICSAMGFAYVIKAFGCDQELVKALSRPLLSARFLAVPGTILIGFMVNITIISQTSTSLAVGTVLIPLLRSLGLRGVVIGSALVLGSSIGGELLNPGAPELGTVADRLSLTRPVIRDEVAKVLFVHLAVAVLIFLWLRRHELLQKDEVELAAVSINWLQAIVPLVPILLLLVLGPPLEWLSWPKHWLLGEKDAPGLYSSRLIGLSMLIGCMVACLACPRQTGSVARHFFDGAGYGYIHIISLIIIAKCFSQGIKLPGITLVIGHLAEAWPALLIPLAALLPALLAFLSGSGIGATQGLYPLLADVAMAQGVSPVDVGVVCCIGSAAGRTASLVAAVVLMCSQLTESKPAEISKRVLTPLALGLAIVVAIMMLKHLGR